MKGKKGTFLNQERRKMSFWSGEGVRFSDPGETCAEEYQEILEGKATLAFSLKDSKCIIICNISFVVMSSSPGLCN
jgi:hypothetical protein